MLSQIVLKRVLHHLENRKRSLLGQVHKSKANNKVFLVEIEKDINDLSELIEIITGELNNSTSNGLN